MDMQDRIFYAAARAQLMAAKAEWARTEHPPDRSGRSRPSSHGPDGRRALTSHSSSITSWGEANRSTQAAIRHRCEMARARCAVQMIYQKRFDEAKHPRAPAGRPDGGQFVRAHDGASAEGFDESLLRRLKQLRDADDKGRFDEFNQLTTAELLAKLHHHMREAAEIPAIPWMEEFRFRQKALADHVQRVLVARNFSDENAPLAVKERLWKAKQRYTELFPLLRRAEHGLAEIKRLHLERTEFATLSGKRLQAIKDEMQELAKVTGAKLPEDNPIRTWSFEQKFARAAEIALRSGDLAPEVAAQLMAAVEPANLARSAAMMAALAVAHSYPLAGLAADTLLLGYVGTDGALVAYRLYLEISSIQSEADLHAAAKVLNQEIAAQSAGKLIQLLTWGGGKGTAAFNKRYKIALDHAKVKRLSSGSMPLSPNPTNLVPFRIQPRTKVSIPKLGISLNPRTLGKRIPKPSFGEPGAAEWRYLRYLINKRKIKTTHLPFDQWKARHFDTAAAGGRPGRRGGPIQVRARKMLEAEGFVNVENVKLGGKYPDMVRDNRKGGKDYVEVGVMLKNGKPQAREFRKLKKEVKALGPNDTMTFVDKHNLSNRVTYHRGDVLE